MKKFIYILLLLCISYYTLYSQNNKAFSWGYNWLGQLGDGTITDRGTPVKIGTGKNLISISCGYAHNLGIDIDGGLWGWGWNSYGELGEVTSTNVQSSPFQIDIGTDWASVSCGRFYSLGIKSDGTLWGWGYNEYGGLGDGTTTNRPSPVQIGNDADWASVSCGGFHTLAIKEDNTLWAWGINWDGQLGDGTTTNRYSPVQIGTDSDWASVSCCERYTLAIKNDGTLWAWGWNLYGQLGDGTTTDRASPVQIGTDSDWASVSCCEDHTLAIKSNGTLWAWGDNFYSVLGDGTATNRYSPVQIGTDADWASVSTGYYHSVGLKTDGTLWSWGWNWHGELGNGTDTDRYSPDQIGVCTKWAYIDCGYSHTIALGKEIPMPSISVDPEYTVNPGGNSHTIYIGYGLQSVELAASGGTTYSWTSDPAGFSSTEHNPTVSPTETTTYYVEATNDYGCTATESVTIYVQDIRCKNGKVYVCHNNKKTLFIPVSDVSEHLAHGDYLGSCESNGKFGIGEEEIGTQSATLEFSPNPLSSSAHFTLEVFDPVMISIDIVDIFGKSVANLMNEQKTAGTYEFDFDASDLPPGVYYCHLMVGDEITTMKLVIVR